MYVIHIDYTLRACHAQVVHTTQHSMYTTMYAQGRMHTAQYTLYYVHTHICWIHTQYMMYTYIHYTIHRDTYTHTIHVYYWIIIK